MRDRTQPAQLPAMIALFGGALAIGSAPIFVRVSETGPTATAFWRGALALPLLALWALLERRARPPSARASLREPLFLWAGAFFAGDLAFWHSSILLTSVAAATLEANCAPILVTLITWLWWRERPRPAFLLAIALAFGGMLFILAPKLGAAGGAAHGLLGDALGLGTACFYAGYILAVARLRGRHGTGIVMFASTLVFTLLLLPLALMQRFLPVSAHGWWLLIGVALSAQALGQSLIAYALAHLPATFGAVGLYLQVIAATLYAWLLLGERLEPVQLAGGVVVLVAIALAPWARAPLETPPPDAALLPAAARAAMGARTPPSESG